MKYIHVLWHSDLKFFPQLVNMIDKEGSRFEASEHYFVTPFAEVYRAIAHHSNVELLECGSSDRDLARFLNKKCEHFKYIFLHGCVRKLGILLLKNEVARKIVYRTWGGDLLFAWKTKDSFYLKMKHLVLSSLNPVLKKRYRTFAAIGVANIVDDLYIAEKIGSVRTFQLGYADGIGLKREDVFSAVYSKDDRIIDVLVGHAGTPGDNHIPMLHTIHRFINDGIRVNLVLSYGDSQYIDQVSNEAISIFGNKANIIREMLPKEDYVNFLRGIDIAILDDARSSALGNLSWLIAFEKTIYVNRNGAIGKAMLKTGIPTRFTDEIKKMSFEEFSAKSIYKTPGRDSQLAPSGYEMVAKRWLDALTALDGSNNG